MGEEICNLLHPNETGKDPWQALLDEESNETVYKLPTFFLLCLLMVVGLPGNVLVLLVYGFKFPASTTKSFIMAMAVFDLINCFLGMPFEMVDLRYDTDFNIPVACKIIRFWITLSTCGSVTILLAVSIDRFRRICRAFQKQMTVKQSRLIIGAMAVASALFSVPALILYGRHTEQRYGMELHDCSIDDTYKGGTFAAVYQYILGTTCVICIIVLIIMYSFIIYKIQLQKKRREKLSNQSLGSTVLIKLKMLSDERSSNENHRDINRSKHEDSSLVKRVNGSTNNGMVSCDCNTLLLQAPDDCVSSEERNNKSVSRLFSRDVNPVFGEGGGSAEIGALTFCGNGRHADMSELSSRERLIGFAGRSTNNSRPTSLDIGLVKRSGSLVQRNTVEECELNQSRDVSQHESRKYARLLVKQRPWESEELMHQVIYGSPSSKCHCNSGSDHVLSDVETSAVDSCKQIRRTSSLCSLKCFGKEDLNIDQVHGIPQNRGNSHSAITNSGKDDKRTSLQLQTRASSTTEANSVGLISNNFMDKTVEETNQINLTLSHSDTNLEHTSDLQAGLLTVQCSAAVVQQKKKYTSASIISTFSRKKRKKFCSREIKTSKVSLMMLMVTVGFVLSYLPHLCIQVFKNLSPNGAARLLCKSHFYFVTHHFLMRSFFINNAINPIIYSFYNKTFRDRCVRLFKSPKSLLLSTQYPVGGGPSFSQDNDTA